MVKKKTGLIVGGTLAAAVVLGGGAYAAVNFMGESELNLASVTPANSFVYAELDLDPSGKQKINAVGSINKIEEIVNSMEEKEEDKMNVEEALYEEQFPDIPLEEINEWSAGQMAWTAVERSGDKYADGSHYGITIYEITDSEKAQATVDKVLAQKDDEKSGRHNLEKAHYEVLDGYMVVAENKEAYEAYQSAVSKGVLSDDPNFTSDRESFDDDFGYVWSDIGLAQKALNKEAKSNPVASPYAGVVADEEEQPEVEGRFAGSLSFQNKSIDLTMKTFQVKVDGETITDESEDTGMPLLGELHKDSVAGFAISDPSGNLKRNWSDMEKTLSKVELAQFETAIQEFTGVAIPEEAENLLGNEITVGLGLEPETETTPMDFNFEALAKGDTKDAWNKIADTTKQMGGEIQLDVSEKDGTTRISKSGYDAPSDKLSTHELYSAGLPDIEKSTTALWLNIDELVDSLPQDAQDEIKVEDLGVIGMTTQAVDGESVAKVRWTFK